MPHHRAPDGSQTLERGLRVLSLLAERSEGLTAAEVAQQLGVHRSVSYRLLTSLVRTGYADRDEQARYRVGTALLGLTEHIRPDLRQAAEPHLQRLAQTYDATACLLVRDGAAAVAVTVVEPRTDGVHLSYRVGNRDPIDLGAGSLALQAASAPVEGESRRVADVRRQGHARTSGEITPGTHAVAAPVITRHPDGPASVLLLSHSASVVRKATDDVMATARAVATELG